MSTVIMLLFALAIKLANSTKYYAVVLRSASGLSDADGWPAGESDPYCEILADGSVVKTTSTEDNTHNPFWNVFVRVEGNVNAFTFRVYDNDYGWSADEFLGSASLYTSGIECRECTVSWHDDGITQIVDNWDYCGTLHEKTLSINGGGSLSVWGQCYTIEWLTGSAIIYDAHFEGEKKSPYSTINVFWFALSALVLVNMSCIIYYLIQRCRSVQQYKFTKVVNYAEESECENDINHKL